MKLRIVIVVIGLLIGLLAREAARYYRQLRPHPAVTPLPAATTPAIKVEREKNDAARKRLTPTFRVALP